LLSSTVFNRECVTIRVYHARFFKGVACGEAATSRKRLSFAFESVVSDFPKAGVAELADALDSKSSGRKAVWVRAPPPADSLRLGVERSTFQPVISIWVRPANSKDASRLRIKPTARQAAPLGVTTFVSGDRIISLALVE
jgi:hypothetical protein